MEQVTRRTFNRQALGSFLTYSLLETLFTNDLWADAVKPIAAKWLTNLDQLGRDVKGQELDQVAWQDKVEELFAQIDLPELMRFIDFDRLATSTELIDRGARSMRFQFPKVEGLPEELVFGKQIFGLKKGRSVVPHGHNNMVTAFLMLKGELRGRHYDRVEDADDHFIIRPTIDRTFERGGCSTISDHKDNIHWFQALSEPAYIFNIHVLNTAPGSTLPTGRVYLNPRGEKLEGGLIRAPRIGYKESNRLFG
jgi:hypothetical protein